MAIREAVICDECDALKREVNHWWRGYLRNDGSLYLLPWDSIPVLGSDASTKSEVHLCGSNCALRWVSAQMAVIAKTPEGGCIHA